MERSDQNGGLGSIEGYNEPKKPVEQPLIDKIPGYDTPPAVNVLPSINVYENTDKSRGQSNNSLQDFVNTLTKFQNQVPQQEQIGALVEVLNDTALQLSNKQQVEDVAQLQQCLERMITRHSR